MQIIVIQTGLGASYSEKPVFEKGTQSSAIGNGNTVATVLRC
jgi:hypothetical protein